MVESVYCAVRTDSLYKADYISSLKGYHAKTSSKIFTYISVVTNINLVSYLNILTSRSGVA